MQFFVRFGNIARLLSLLSLQALRCPYSDSSHVTASYNFRSIIIIKT